mmetsp:Transcript_49415/g.116438  ORF Transcript_49415/g.116438 Transcript_49415/m.116438 type:complete len:259 (-) Transcript_49415:1263-2039(-)
MARISSSRCLLCSRQNSRPDSHPAQNCPSGSRHTRSAWALWRSLRSCIPTLCADQRAVWAFQATPHSAPSGSVPSAYWSTPSANIASRSSSHSPPLHTCPPVPSGRSPSHTQPFPSGLIANLTMRLPLALQSVICRASPGVMSFHWCVCVASPGSSTSRIQLPSLGPSCTCTHSPGDSSYTWGRLERRCMVTSLSLLAKSHPLTPLTSTWMYTSLCSPRTRTREPTSVSRSTVVIGSTLADRWHGHSRSASPTLFTTL